MLNHFLYSKYKMPPKNEVARLKFSIVSRIEMLFECTILMSLFSFFSFLFSCSNKLYLSELPTVSVVVPFFNEHWSTLLRTCYSVLNRSPPELIVEIILVDDCSTKPFLQEKLDGYVHEHLPKVKIVRLPERSGLIIARLAGAKVAHGDVLLFLDSHTEANTNWLPPLLGRCIAKLQIFIQKE